VEAHVRRRRRLSVVAATVLAFALLPSAAAFAAAQYSLGVFDGGSRFGSEIDVFASGTTAEVPGPIRLVVRRGGSPVLDKTGSYDTFSGRAGSEAFADFLPAVGDVIEIYNPAGAQAPARTYNYTGRPSLESCPVGSRTATGRVDPNTVVRGSAFRPSAQSGDPNRNNRGFVTQNGESYTLTLQRPVAAGDILSVSGFRQVDADFDYFQSVQRGAGECVPLVVPVVQPTPAQPATGLDGVVNPLRKRDVKQGKNGRIIKVRVRCNAASTIRCRGQVGAQTVRRFAKLTAVSSAKKKAKKRVTLATKKFSVAPGKSKTVTLKLKKSAYRLLKRQRRLKTRITVVSKDKAGKRLATTRTLTLKYKKPKKKKG